MPKQSDNEFERRRDLLTVAGKHAVDVLTEAIGVRRPYGHVKLTTEEKRDRWLTMGMDERRRELDALQPRERDQLWRQIGGEG